MLKQLFFGLISTLYLPTLPIKMKYYVYGD